MPAFVPSSVSAYDASKGYYPGSSFIPCGRRWPLFLLSDGRFSYLGSFLSRSRCCTYEEGAPFATKISRSFDRLCQETSEPELASKGEASEPKLASRGEGSEQQRGFLWLFYFFLHPFLSPPLHPLNHILRPLLYCSISCTAPSLQFRLSLPFVLLCTFFSLTNIPHPSFLLRFTLPPTCLTLSFDFTLYIYFYTSTFSSHDAQGSLSTLYYPSGSTPTTPSRATLFSILATSRYLTVHLSQSVRMYLLTL